MARTLLALSLSLTVAWSMNPPRVLLTRNVVLVVDDDRPVCALPQFNVHPDCDQGATGNFQPASIPTLDTMASLGVRVARFQALPQCNVSRATLITGRYPHQIRTSNFAGNYSFGEPTIPRELRRLAPDVVSIQLGKDAAAPDNGYCSHDLSITCEWGDECGEGNTCDYPSTAHPAYTPAIFAGWDEWRGAVAFNGPFSGYDKETATRITDTTYSFALESSVSEYFDAGVLGDFGELWHQYAGRRRFFLVAPKNPHDPTHNPPTVPLDQTGSIEERYESQVEYVADTVLGGILAEIGSEIDETCVLYISDNGIDLTGATQLRGRKGAIYQGATQTGLMARGSCVAPSLEGEVVEVVMDLPDLTRIVLELFDAYDPPELMATFAADSRMNGQPLVMLGDPLLSALSGYCPTSDCYPNAPNRGAYALGGVRSSGEDIRPRSQLDDSGYKLIVEYAGTTYGEDPWQLYLLPDESTDLWDGSLTPTEQAAFDTLLAAMDANEADNQHDLVNISLEAASGAPVEDVPFSWRIRVANDGETADAQPPPTSVVCDVDFDDGAGPVRVMRQIEALDDASKNVFDHYYDHQVTYPDPGPINVLGSCFDILDRTNPFIVDIDATVS